MANQKTTVAFFGSAPFSLLTLDALEDEGLTPSLIVTAPPKPRGRALAVSPSPVASWAEKRRVPVLAPAHCRGEAFLASLAAANCAVGVVAGYGALLPPAVLDAFPKKTLNIHPSLLPKFRGASPIRSAILADDRDTGVTIMLLDEKLDHGPVIGAEKVPAPDWPPTGSGLERLLARAGAKLLARLLPEWMGGRIAPVPQDESKATYSRKIAKEDGLIDLAGDPYENYRKFRAFDTWPGTYFFARRGETEIRVIIKDARFEAGALRILRVLPENRKEIGYEDFLNGLRSSAA